MERTLGHVLRSQHHENRIDTSIFHRRIDGSGIMAGLGIGGNVDRVVDKGRRRQGSTQFIGQGIAEARDTES
jgi:hypothetical protein